MHYNWDENKIQLSKLFIKYYDSINYKGDERKNSYLPFTGHTIS